MITTFVFAAALGAHVVPDAPPSSAATAPSPTEATTEASDEANPGQPSPADEEAKAAPAPKLPVAPPAPPRPPPKEMNEEAACQDVYDRNADCTGLMLDPLEAPGDPVTASELDETPIELDSDWFGWGFMAGGAVFVVGAFGFHAAAFAYSMYLQDQTQRGAIGPDQLTVSSRVQLGILAGAGTMWFIAALLGGAGMSFLSFDPLSGEIKLPFFSSGE